MNYSHIKALLIDIDDTITRLRPMALGSEAGENKGDLFSILQAAGVKLGGLTPEEAARRIARVKSEIRWWHFSDFIVELELDPKKFWRYALEQSRRYLEPTGTEIRGALQALHDAGILLYITSNNPSSGILHKLQVAGIATVNGSTMFSQLLGATELNAMKWEPLYWKKVLAHIALDASEVAVVGDNPRDDCEVPQSIGITHTFLINRATDHSPENSAAITHVQNFSMIADCILGTFPTEIPSEDTDYVCERMPILSNSILPDHVKA